MKSSKTKPNFTYDIEVKRAKIYNDNITFFDMIVNGITLYGCKYIEHDKGDFIGFPSTKSGDGKFYNIFYFPVTDYIDVIKSQIEKLV